MSNTFNLIDAMADHLEAHSWETITPRIVYRSPIPPGSIVFPALAVYVVGGIEEAKGGYGVSQIREVVQWTFADSLGVGDVEAQYMDHIRWRDEVRGLARRAIDNYWGLGGVVTNAFLDPVWESSFFQQGDDIDSMEHLVSTTLRMEVEYREQF